MSDVRPSVPRTPAQVTLRVVSAIMAILGGLVLLGAGLVFLYGDRLGLANEGMWTVLTYGGIILAAAALLLLTAYLGLKAADDASRVGPYRFLCYFVGLVLLVAIVWGWGMGMFILFTPVVLASTVTYFLVCSTLADKVAQEHEAGVKGEVFLRTGRQRTLHLLAEIIIVKGALVAVVVGIASIALYAAGNASMLDELGLDEQSALVALVSNGVAAAVNIGVGALGIWGSNRPEKIVPFFAVSVIAVALDAARVVGGIVAASELGAPSIDVLLDLLYMGSCTWLAWKVWRQPRELVDKRMIAAQ